MNHKDTKAQSRTKLRACFVSWRLCRRCFFQQLLDGQVKTPQSLGENTLNWKPHGRRANAF
jgi:hypothetical protein